VNLVAARENIAVVLALHKGLTCRQLAQQLEPKNNKRPVPESKK
jgi:hypothetical protein